MKFRSILVVFLFGICGPLCYGLTCYTCNVDFRIQLFNLNNSCLFPKDPREKAHCSAASKFCKAIITRVGGVFLMLQRSCSKNCTIFCTEKGFGIRTKDCTSCCTKEADCGTAELMKTQSNMEVKDDRRNNEGNKKNRATHNIFSEKSFWILLMYIVYVLK